MKFTVNKPVEIDVKYLEMRLPVRYGTEDIPADFPLRKGDQWNVCVELETGQIKCWPPQSETRHLHMKVCDEGTYILKSEDLQELALIDGYVPSVIPGEYGDYVDLEISPSGKILNWPKNPDISDFFPAQD